MTSELGFACISKSHNSNPAQVRNVANQVKEIEQNVNTVNIENNTVSIAKQNQVEKTNFNSQGQEETEVERFAKQQPANINQNTQTQQIYNEMGIGKNINILA